MTTIEELYNELKPIRAEQILMHAMKYVNEVYASVILQRALCEIRNPNKCTCK